MAIKQSCISLDREDNLCDMTPIFKVIRIVAIYKYHFKQRVSTCCKIRQAENSFPPELISEPKISFAMKMLHKKFLPPTKGIYKVIDYALTNN